jgi:hypothetical protein
MVIGLDEGRIEVRHSTGSGKFVKEQFPATDEGGRKCVQHILRILKSHPQPLGLSSDAFHPDEFGFAEDFDVEEFLKPHFEEATR